MPGTGLWRTKSVEQSIADTDEPESRLRKNLSAWDLTVFGVAVVIGAGIFTLTARTAGDLTGPSVSLAFVLAMSRDGLLPRGLSRIGERGTPLRATILVGVLVAVAATFFPASKPEEMVNVGTLFAFILVSAGVLVLRRTHPDLPRAFRVPALPVIGVAAILACLWLMLNLTILTWLRFFGWMAIGVVVYFAYGRRHSLLGRRDPPASR